MLIMSSARDIKLTIFTPAYNRSHLLGRLFKSIYAQVNSESMVEWLIIDDGSTDNTYDVVTAFPQHDCMIINYVRTDNGGKHRAINAAAKMAIGEWVMIVDSDDYLVDDAIGYIINLISDINNDLEIGIIRGLKIFPDSKKNNKFHLKNNPGTYVQWLNGQELFESSEVIRRNVLLTHPFPEYKGEIFMAEGWLWIDIDYTHKTLFVNKEIMVCYYQPGGLSELSNIHRARSPRSAMAVYDVMINTSFNYNIKLRACVNWWRYYFHLRSINKGYVNKKPHYIFAIIGYFMFKCDSSNKNR
jgi:glycosyltransferase involved in cell wall biosynthesis